MLVPSIIILIVLIIVPLVYLFYNSLFYFRLTEMVNKRFVGIENYSIISRDGQFFNALSNTFVYIAIGTGAQMMLGLLLAEILSRKFRGKNLVRTVLLFPMIIPPITVGIIWWFLYHPTWGFITYFLNVIGVHINWLSNPGIALLAIILADTWEWTPFVLLILMAGYVAIPEDIYEAAEMDGATGWHKFFHITLPLIKPSIVVAIIFRTVDIIKVFPKIFVMTGGGPGSATETLNLYTYRVGFTYTDIGYSSALGFTTLLLTLVLTLLIIIFSIKGRAI